MLHHGRELQCVVLMSAPHDQALMAVITGGDDGTVRRLLYSPQHKPQVKCPQDGAHCDRTCVRHARMNVQACIIVICAALIMNSLLPCVQGLHSSVEVGEHAAGTPVKSISVVGIAPGLSDLI